jgi:membrane-associated protease RseP (regulator of RpoE activity)
LFECVVVFVLLILLKQYLVAFSTDSTTALSRTSMLVAQVANSKTVDVTPQFNTTGLVLSGDPLACLATGVSCPFCFGIGCGIFQGSVNIDCRSSTIFYGTNLLTPTGASTNAFYSVPLVGGPTSRLTWDPSVGVSASSLSLQKSTATVGFSGNLFAGTVTDFFVNSAISSLVTVALVTWVALLIAVAF